MDPKTRQLILKLLIIASLQFPSGVEGQRPNKPVYEYDMNMFDAAELCRKIGLTENKTDVSLTTFMHPSKCFFFRWIYCPDEMESETHPCGWWEQTPCDCDKPPHVGHNEQKGTNPEGVHPPPAEYIGVGSGTSTADPSIFTTTPPTETNTTTGQIETTLIPVTQGRRASMRRKLQSKRH